MAKPTTQNKGKGPMRGTRATPSAPTKGKEYQKRQAPGQATSGAAKRPKREYGGNEKGAAAAAAGSEPAGYTADGRPRSAAEQMVYEAKVLLGTALRSDDNKERTAAVSEKVFPRVRGHLREVCLKHDASRVVQASLKYGTPEVRAQVIAELNADTLDLAKSKYSYRIPIKMMKYASDRAARDSVVTKLLGSAPTLLRHMFASHVLEEAFSVHATAKQQAAFVEEFYGAEWTVFKPEARRSLGEALKESPAKRNGVMERLKEHITALANKEFPVDCTLFHHVAAAYFSECTDAEAADLVPILAPLLIRMTHTREGAKVAVRCVGLAGAKDRKVIVKTAKGHVIDMAKDQWARLLLMSLLDRTDDTALLSAVILDPLIAEFPALLRDTYAHQPILHLLSPRNASYFDRPTIAALTVTGETSDGTTSTSHKPADQRRSELLEHIAPELLRAVSSEPIELLKNTFGSRVVAETLISCPGDKSAVVAALADSIAGMKTGEEGEGDEEGGPVEDNIGNRAVQRLLRPDMGEIATELAEALVDRLGAKGLKEWSATNRKAFVVAAILSATPAGKQRNYVSGMLAAVRGDISKSALAGVKVLDGVLNGKPLRDAGKKTANDE